MRSASAMLFPTAVAAFVAKSVDALTASGKAKAPNLPSSLLISWRRGLQNSRPMAKPPVMAKESTGKTPATLGDVLYAKSNAPGSEQDWAALVQSVAAGDQLALHALYDRAHRIVFTLIIANHGQPGNH
jgi:hypothetical protein